MAKIAVTGAGGQIGGYLVKRLLDEGSEVRAIDIKPLPEWTQLHQGAVTNISSDMASIYNAKSYLEGYSVVYNLAAQMGGYPWIVAHPVECMQSFAIAMSVFEAARENDAKVFYSSSACVFPNYLQGVEEVYLKEGDAWPYDGEFGYGDEKIMSERLLEAYRKEYGLDSRIARFHNIFSPKCAYDGGREKAPGAICRKVATAVLTGDHEIQIIGDGHQTRSFLFISECLEGVQRLMESDHTEPLNIGSDELVSINELVDMVEDIAGIPNKLKRVYDPSGPVGVRGRCSDNTKIQEVLDWAPSARLYDGLVPVYQEVYDQVAKDLGK